MRCVTLAEVNVVLSWDGAAQQAYRKSLESYIKAGSPPIPLGSTNYKKEFLRVKKNRRARENRAKNSKQGVAT